MYVVIDTNRERDCSGFVSGDICSSYDICSHTHTHRCAHATSSSCSNSETLTEGLSWSLLSARGTVVAAAG